MPKYVALLRGIAPVNPNMHGSKLRGVFEKLGFRNVTTVLSSGNVLFESRVANSTKLESMIEKALPRYLGFSSTTIVRNQEQLEKLVKRDPFKRIGHNQKTYLTVTFFKNTPQVKFRFPFSPENSSYKLIGIYDGALCSVVDLTGAKTPDFMVWLEKQFSKEITTRTWNTVKRILEKLQADKHL